MKSIDICRWYVDSVPIRVFRNYQSTHGVAFPTSRPMFAYSSIWAAEDWATQGGRIKTDWSKAPFVANYNNIHLDICQCGSGGYGGGGCATGCPAYNGACELSPAEQGQLQWVQGNYRFYDYCTDPKRMVNGKPPVECDLRQY
jgi:xyloglucan:xyloglucosyl transferase